MTVAVIGGTGTVGRLVVQGLLKAGVHPGVLVRDEAKAAALPAGAHGLIGDLERPLTVEAALTGFDRLFLLTPLSPREVELGVGAVDAASKAGIQRVVLLSVHHAEKARQIPNFHSKVVIEEALTAAGIPTTTLMPSSFMQNDLRTRHAILDLGIYPHPIGGRGVSRVDVRDIADAAVAALTRDGHEGRRCALVGPEAQTGDSVAAGWSHHLGRSVRYAGDDLDAWEANVAALMPPWMVRDLRVMYEHFQEEGLVASADELAAQEGLVGHPPRSFDAFAAETAAAWS